MNTNFSDMLMNGILICLYTQLIIIGVFNIFNKRPRNIILGLICCLMAISFIYTIYWPKLNLNLIANILVGGYKHVFLPSLIYLYLALIIKKNQSHLLLRHLLFPLIIHVSYLVIKFEPSDFYSSNIVNIVAVVNFFIFFSYLFYLIKCIKLLRSLKLVLLSKVLKRYIAFFIILSIYGIVLVSEALISYLLYDEKLKSTFGFLSSSFYVNLAIIINLGMLIFAFIESPVLKPILLGEKIYTGFDRIKNDEKIITFIRNTFDEKKLFLDANFDLFSILIDSGVDEKEFKLYLKKEFDQSPIVFINKYRIEEFKRLVKKGENKKYSLMGIANKVGYNSKATFYRNFKNIEGVTPKQYLNSSIEK